MATEEVTVLYEQNINIPLNKWILQRKEINECPHTNSM